MPILNNLSVYLIAAIVGLCIIISIQHVKLEAFESQQEAHKIEDQMEKQHNLAEKQAAEVALTKANQQIAQVNESVKTILKEPVKANCDDVLTFLVKHAGEQNGK